jgi:hypothetical protein
MRPTPLLLALLLAPVHAADTVRTEAAALRFSVPTAWTRVPAASDVRAAQFRLPRAAGDTDDAEVVLFFFGPGKGGGVPDNLERWYGQITQPDGRPSRDVAVQSERTVNGLRVTAVDVSGTYRGMGMSPATPGPERPDYRLLAAVVEGEGGPWFLKAVGPRNTIARAKPAFDALLGSLEAHR